MSGLNGFLQAVYKIIAPVITAVKAIKSLCSARLIFIKKFFLVKKKRPANQQFRKQLIRFQTIFPIKTSIFSDKISVKKSR